MRADEEYMVSLWQHEVTRVVKDRICRSVDIKWFEKTLKTIIKEVQHLRKKHILGFFYLCRAFHKTIWQLCLIVWVLICFRTFLSCLPTHRLLCLSHFRWTQDCTLSVLWPKDVLCLRFVCRSEATFCTLKQNLKEILMLLILSYTHKKYNVNLRVCMWANITNWCREIVKDRKQHSAKHVLCLIHTK